MTSTQQQQSVGMRPEGEERRARVIVLAMGNDILGDDAVGFLAARALRSEFASQVDFIETGEAGLALVELLEGYEKALLLDASATGRYDVGSVLEFTTNDFSRVVAPSPHYAGLPEVLYLAKSLGLKFPEDIRILAMEVEDPFTVREELSPAVEAALPRFIGRAREVVTELLADTK